MLVGEILSLAISLVFKFKQFFHHCLWDKTSFILVKTQPGSCVQVVINSSSLELFGPSLKVAGLTRSLSKRNFKTIYFASSWLLNTSPAMNMPHLTRLCWIWFQHAMPIQDLWFIYGWESLPSFLVQTNVSDWQKNKHTKKAKASAFCMLNLNYIKQKRTAS